MLGGGLGGQTLHFGVLASQLEKDLKVVIAHGRVSSPDIDAVKYQHLQNILYLG